MSDNIGLFGYNERVFRLLLRSNAGMVVSSLEVHVLDELGSSLNEVPPLHDPHSLSRVSFLVSNLCPVWLWV